MSDIKIISLGGVRETGKNMYLVEVDNSIYVLDCGLVYPPDEMLGIDIMIPDFSYLVENADRIAGVFLTHGHADAIGALGYLIKEVEVPVFGTELTIELAKIQARQLGLKNYPDFHIIDADNEIDFGDVVVKFFRTTHSVPDSVGIDLVTKEGSIVYTGDFKFDMTVKADYATDFGRITEIGKDGVFALLSDSSQAEAITENEPEVVLANGLISEMRKADGRVIVASVANNLQRLQQILDAAATLDRHVFLMNDEVEEIIDVAIRLGKLDIPSSNLIKKLKTIDQYDDNQIVILETGKTGEPLFTLQKMASNHRFPVSIQDGDRVIIATSPTIDMETVVADTKNQVYKAGGTVVELTEEYKSSGHASPKDLQLLLQLLKPQYFIPISGEFRLMHSHAELAIATGYSPDNIFLLDKGDVLHYEKNKMRLANKVTAGNVLIDGSGVGDIGNIVLRDRRILSEDGIFVVVLTISRRLGKILSGPEIISRGFVYMKASEDLLAESKQTVVDVVNENLQSKDFEWAKLKGDIRDQLSKKLFQATSRRPMILPVIMEASNYQPSKHKNKKNK
ncbi:ribonuclease J [Aerococcus kribbianus]|uniref:Ribonuclease J n=1 Tax=Aerococcus kribbianus TaxID=2999064 RepID=A0A9X3FMD9_9LACT|nr:MULTISPECIES: ribonuclease J [unclassified Aerococcus]MCZ0717207.1 ribonuclease J [Aerococcus sp. YH-aer221]MCZ0725495.1 ribonuclease J [Aerococcus sp. YH-aer222]